MSISPDNPLPPLKGPQPAPLPLAALLAVEEVTLQAGDIPRGILRRFYVELLGMTFVAGEAGEVCFVYERRRVRLVREAGEPGRLGLLSRRFGEALLKLREHGVSYELFHTDGGLTKMALFRDPAGNWVHLLETRPF